MKKIVGFVALLLLGMGASSVQAQTGAPATLHYADTSKSPLYAQYYVAQAKGLFAKHNLNVVAVSVGAGAPVLAAMATGDIDVGGVAPAQVVLAVQSGADIKIICTGELPVPYVGIARSGLSVHSLKDVKGMKIANVAAGSGFDSLIRYMLHDAGLDPDKDVQMVNLGVAPGAWLSAFQNKQVDVGPVMVEPWISIIEDAKAGYPFLDLAKDGPHGVPDMINTAFLASGRFVKNKPEQAKQFVQAITEADAFLNDPANREEATAIVAKAIGGDPKFSRKTLEAVGSRWSSGVTHANIDDTVKFMKATGQIQKDIDIKFEKLVAVGIAPEK